MSKIFVNYDPFAKESQILIESADGTTGTVYGDSELSRLAETVALRANELGVEQTKVYVRAPKVFYDKLSSFVQAAQQNYTIAQPINMERV